MLFIFFKNEFHVIDFKNGYLPLINVINSLLLV